MIKILVMTYFYDFKTCYDVSAFTLCNGAMAGWLIYGYVIFYSKSNNCDKIEDTSFLNSLMFVILFLSYIMGFIYILMILTLPCIYMMAREAGNTHAAAHNNRNMMANAQVPRILASL
jgi:hypothetical protein